MRTNSFIIVISAVAISVIVLIGSILTSALRSPDRQPRDKNGPGVVRVSVVDGSAIVKRGDSSVQTNAVRNAPMLPGDYISTGKMSRAELQFDGYTAVRLGPDVQARIVSNDGRNLKLQLASGVIAIGTVRDGETMQVDTPSVTVRARQAGDYRISIAADGSSSITARRGAVDVVTPQGVNTVGTDTRLIARGSASHPSIASGPQVALDSFDQFNTDRDKVMVAALNASPNLNPTIAGYENLGAYGHWQAIPGYGQSWVPNEPASWVPYRNGSWAWENRYGWTWIGSEPWGWTPYHYGNWYYCSCGSSGWAWLPPASANAPWSPALVGFFGFDVASTGGYNNCGGNYAYAPGSYSAPAAQYSNAAPAAAPASAPYNEAAPNEAAPAPYGEGGPSAPAPSGPAPYSNPAPPYGMGSGYPPPAGYPYPYIGWVPIAPYEPFYPWYPSWGLGFGFPSTSIINITNVTYVNRIFRNFRHGGATGTTFRHFRHGTISGHTVGVTDRDIGHRFGSIHGTLPIRPTRDNLAFAHGKVKAPVTFSKLFDSRRFASTGALAARTSFSHRQKAVAEHPGAVSASRVSVPGHHVNGTVARANVPETHMRALQTRWNPPAVRENAPVTRVNTAPALRRENAELRGTAFTSHQLQATRHENVPATRQENAPVTRHENAPMTRHENAPVTRRENAPVTRENAVPAIRAENSEMREGSAAPRQVEASRNEYAPSASWERFNAARSEAAMDSRGGGVPATSEARREERAPSDSWGRFSQQRGDVSAPAANDRGPYSRESNPYPRENRYDQNPYGHNPYGRNPDERPSYARPSYGAPPPYSRGSYGAPPPYSRGSFGAPPPSSRGSNGGAPPARGAPAPSRPSGGGSDRHGGRGRPPQ
jgi:FecR protein